MSASVHESSESLAREGRFAEALAALGNGGKHEALISQVLRAELLEHTGAYSNAQQLAQELLRSKHLERTMESRLDVTLGHIAFTRGQIDTARQHYTKAIKQARASANLEQLTRSQLRLLHTLRTQSDEPGVASLISELKSGVLRLGNPHMTAALHLAVAQCEWEREAFDVAAQHIDIAESILESHSNAWLKAHAEVGWTTLEFFTDDLDAAQQHAEDALKWSRASGAFLEWASSLGNIAQIQLARGNPQLARSFIEQALPAVERGGGLHIALVEGLAKAHFMDSDLGRASELLSEIHSVIHSWTERLPYPHRWTQPMLVRLAMARGDNRQAAQLASEGVQIARVLSDTRLERVLLALWIEAIAPKRSANVPDLLAAAFDLRDGSIAIHADLERVTGIALASCGNRDLAVSHFARSMRLFASIGRLADERRTEGELRMCQSAIGGVEDVSKGCGDRLGSPDPGSSEMILASVAGLTRLSGSSEAVAIEAFELLRSVRCASRISLEGARPEGWIILRESRDSMSGRNEASVNPITIEIDCRKNKSRILAWPNSDVTSVANLLNIKAVIDAAMERRALRVSQRQSAALWPVCEGGRQGDLPGIFSGDKIRGLLDVVKRAAATNISVLVTGETGTGKELIARLIHQWSSRSGQPLVPFNCSAVARDMLDAQLFGHRRGAFTGAVESFQGVIRAANGGTLFLDEVGEIALELQPKLLRFLESSEVHPVGEPRPVAVDVRVVAATNSRLENLVAEHQFREDLFYRLNVFRVRIPPLRERRDEIPLLAGYFIEKYAGEQSRRSVVIAPEALEYLALRDWPGNVRELSNCIRRAVVLAAPAGVIGVEHVCADNEDACSSAASEKPQEIRLSLEQPLAEAFQQIERAMIAHAIQRAGGQMEEAAKLIGLSRKGLYLKRQRHGIVM